MQKLINNALEKEGKVGVSKRFCGICDEETTWAVCRGIGDKSHDPEPTRFHEKQWIKLDYKQMWDEALHRCQRGGEAPPNVKGVKNLKSLIILFLERNNIMNFNLKDIEDLRNLNFIFLNDNPLDSESKENYEKRTRFP